MSSSTCIQLKVTYSSLTAEECPSPRYDPNLLSSTRFTFQVRVIQRIRSDSNAEADGGRVIHDSSKEISLLFDRLRAAFAEREAVVADMLSDLEIPFSIDVGENDVDNLLWNEVNPYDDSSLYDMHERETLYGGLNSVVVRISLIAADLVHGDTDRNLAAMNIWIERCSTVPHEEFQRLANSSSTGGAIIIIDYENDRDDEAFNWGVEQSLLESRSLLRAAEGLERFRYEGGMNHDHHDASKLMTCVICMEKVMIGSELIRMPCSPQFHEDCILEWLNRANSCPLCRFSLPSSTNKRSMSLLVPD